MNTFMWLLEDDQAMASLKEVLARTIHRDSRLAATPSIKARSENSLSELQQGGTKKGTKMVDPSKSLGAAY